MRLLLSARRVPAAVSRAGACRWRAAGQRRWTQSGGAEPEKPKQGFTEMMKEHRKAALLVGCAEYVAAGLVFFFACTLLPVATSICDFFGEEKVEGLREYLRSFPVIGEWSPETLTNVALAFVLDEATWPLRIPLLIFLIPRVGKLLK
ncbi:hypothetical protein DIPPA_34012 [Diplonema papillatum]|nr:hypothetical protein DIPPA_34012 [Diplonema papillatum]